MAEHFLGIDMSAAGDGRAVMVSADGTVVRRAHVHADAHGDTVSQEFTAGAEAVGVAFDVPDGGSADERPRVSNEAAVSVSFGAGGAAFVVPIVGDRPPAVTTCSPGAAAVVAEAWIGAARGARHVICLTIGQRVLAGILLDGTPWRGANGRAGAAAWLALNPVERQDYRKFGSLAVEVSDKGIARRLAWRVQAGDESAVADEAGDLEAITAAKVFDGARAGDGVAISVVRDTAKYVGMALANFAVTIDPEVLVLGGDLARASDLLLEPVRQEFARRVPPAMAGQTRIEFSPLAGDGIAIGAARLAMLARA